MAWHGVQVLRIHTHGAIDCPRILINSRQSQARNNAPIDAKDHYVIRKEDITLVGWNFDHHKVLPVLGPRCRPARSSKTSPRRESCGWCSPPPRRSQQSGPRVVRSRDQLGANMDSRCRTFEIKRPFYYLYDSGKLILTSSKFQLDTPSFFQLESDIRYSICGYLPLQCRSSPAFSQLGTRSQAIWDSILCQLSRRPNVKAATLIKHLFGVTFQRLGRTVGNYI